MIISFNKIVIDSFLSIGNAEIDLDSKGVVFVRGVNKFEDKLDSNGSGKSSIFDALVWCLTGHTTRGSSRVTNEYTGRNAEVKLIFNLNNSEYVVIRSDSSPKRLSIFKDSEDISGKTYKNSESILNDELGYLDYQLLTSVIVLSQGLPGRLSSLKPSARKDRLELISGIDSKLRSIIDINDSSLREISSQLRNSNDKMISLVSSVESLEGANSRLEDKIKEINESSMTKDEYENLKNELSEIRRNIETVKSELTDKTTTLYVLKGDSYDLSSSISEIEKTMSDIEDKMQSYVDSKCPTCGSIIDTSDLIMKARNDYRENALRLLESQNKYSSINDEIKEMSSEIDDLNKLSNELSDNEIKLSIAINKFESTNQSVSIVEDAIKSNNLEISENNNNIKGLEPVISDLSKNEKIGNYFKNILNKKFRTFILSDIIEYANKLLEEYSVYLFEDRKVSFDSNGNNIDIKLGGRYFENLSGGEARRVDILLQLVQRKMCESELGFSTNLLVMDEILDNLDISGIESVISMLDSKSEDVDTMMIVSHRADLDINYDSELVVTKGEDQISSIEIYM